MCENCNREQNKRNEEIKHNESILSEDLKPDSALSEIISEATDETDRESRQNQVSASVDDIVELNDDSCIEIVESFQESNR